MSGETKDNNIIKLDKWDYVIATSSGCLTAVADVLFVSDLSLVDASQWGSEQTNNFVKQISKKIGYKGDDQKESIKYLKALSSFLPKEISAKYEVAKKKIEDLSQMPNIGGLTFSILSQFTGMSYFANKDGTLKSNPIVDEVFGGNVAEKVYAGIISWTFNVISNMALFGPSIITKSAKLLPPSFVSLIKDISTYPAIQRIVSTEKEGNVRFSKACYKLLTGNMFHIQSEEGFSIANGEISFDLKTAIGFTNEMLKKKQYLPVLVNNLIVRAVYSIRRFVTYIKNSDIHSVDEITSIDASSFLPWKSDQLKQMLLISSASFSVIDISISGIKAVVKNKDNDKGFLMDFIQGINYFGLSNLTYSLDEKTMTNLANIKGKFLEMVEKQSKRCGFNIAEVENTTLDTATQIGKISEVVNPIGYVDLAVDVYREVKQAVDEHNQAIEETKEIKKLCDENIKIIQENRERIEASVEEYFSNYYKVFFCAFEKMKKGINDNDPNSFIAGNVEIQGALGKTDSFRNLTEFDNIMNSDDKFKL